ncbi:MAG TPA: ABC transporter permease [Candidatus Acetothermia bacterium]|nr:ABC transporter permease [Candidatus Acetothermia bacterium]
MLRRLRELRRYPSAIVGVGIIGLLVIVSIYTVLAIPYPEAVRLWRGGPGVWDDNPRNAQPVWFDWFTGDRLPRTIIVTAEDGGVKRIEPLADGRSRVEIVLPFDYAYDRFPTEITLFTRATYDGTTRTRFAATWHTPNGETIPIVTNRALRATDNYYISQDAQLLMKLGVSPEVGLLSAAASGVPPSARSPAKGRYQLVIQTEIAEGAEFDAKLVVYGQVHGLAGTDHRRRDLTVALLWGTPLALVFGLLAAVGSTLSTFCLAGIGTWFGGKVDALFQRITEVNMILPMLPILIMVGQFYSRSLWLMLGMVIALNIFSAGMKTYRAMFLQAKEAPYIEAARAYGAGNFRTIFRYLLPRIVPVLLPTFVMIVPTFVFLEAALAVIGLGDPLLPTWGKIINDAQSQSALYKGMYYWVVEPAVLLMLTGFAFAMVGFALDRVFNPRLRTV